MHRESFSARRVGKWFAGHALASTLKADMLQGYLDNGGGVYLSQERFCRLVCTLERHRTTGQVFSRFGIEKGRYQ